MFEKNNHKGESQMWVSTFSFKQPNWMKVSSHAFIIYSKHIERTGQFGLFLNLGPHEKSNFDSKLGLSRTMNNGLTNGQTFASLL